MLRVEKYRKVEADRKRNARQLKEARQQLKRVRRANRRAQKLVRDGQRPPITPSKLQAQNDRADFRLLQWVKLGLIETLTDTESKRLEVMIKDGYVLPAKQTYRLSGKGLRLLGELRKRVSHQSQRRNKPATH
jgi:hypothetical protein